MTNFKYVCNDVIIVLFIAVPRQKRGPRCFTCDAQADPESCRDTQLCDLDQVTLFNNVDTSEQSNVNPIRYIFCGNLYNPLYILW